LNELLVSFNALLEDARIDPGVDFVFPRATYKQYGDIKLVTGFEKSTILVTKSAIEGVEEEEEGEVMWEENTKYDLFLDLNKAFRASRDGVFQQNGPFLIARFEKDAVEVVSMQP
jgi:hypothetical protein